MSRHNGSVANNGNGNEQEPSLRPFPREHRAGPVEYASNGDICTGAGGPLQSLTLMFKGGYEDAGGGRFVPTGAESSVVVT